MAKYGGIPYSATKTTLKSSLDTNSKGKKATPSYIKQWKGKEKSEVKEKVTTSVASNTT